MVQDLKRHFNYYFNEKNKNLKDRFFSKVLYIELDNIVKGVLLNCSVFESGAGCLLYENLKQDIHLKIYENITFVSIQSIKNINGYIFTFAKNHVLNELERQNKINKIKTLISEHTN